MFKKIFYVLSFLLLMFSLMPVQAQTESEILSRADAVVKRVVPNAGNIRQWLYTGYVMTNDGALGCSLVTSYNLGYSVVPWRVELTYSNGQTYIVYVSSDPNVSVPCDAKLLGSSVNTYTPTCTGTTNPGTAGTLYTAPNSGVVAGYLNAFGALNITGRTIDSAWYQIGSGGNAGWVSIYEIILTGAGCASLPVTSNIITPLDTTPNNYTGQGTGGQVTCFLTASYANVRTLPSLSGAILEQVTSGATYGVTGRTSGTDWYEVFTRNRAGTGWVSNTVSRVQGAGCGILPITGTSDPSVNPSPTGTIDNRQLVSNTLLNYCPPAYTGYQTPRLQVGARARVISETGILRLRTTPQVLADNSNFVLEIARQEIVDVISGPVCETNTQRIWWQVLYNGIYGWTAESDAAATTAYYLEPINPPARRFTAEDDTPKIGQLEAGGSVSSIAFDSDGTQLLVVNGTDSFARSFDVTTGNNIESALYLNPEGVALKQIIVHPQGTSILTVDANAELIIWSPDGEILARYNPSPNILPALSAKAAVNGDWSQVAVAGCQQASLAGCEVGVVVAFNLTSEDVALWSVEDSAVSAIAYHPQTGELVIGTQNGDVYLWDIATDTTQSLSATNMVQIFALTYSPDATKLAIAYCATPIGQGQICSSAGIMLLNVTDFSLITTLMEHTSPITEMLFSPDGKQLATGGLDNTVILWDIDNAKELNRFTDYIFGVSSLAYNAQGNLLVTGDNAGNVILLNLE